MGQPDHPPMLGVALKKLSARGIIQPDGLQRDPLAEHCHAMPCPPGQQVWQQLRVTQRRKGQQPATGEAMQAAGWEAAQSTSPDARHTASNQVGLSHPLQQTMPPLKTRACQKHCCAHTHPPPCTVAFNKRLAQHTALATALLVRAAMLAFGCCSSRAQPPSQVGLWHCCDAPPWCIDSQGRYFGQGKEEESRQTTEMPEKLSEGQG